MTENTLVSLRNFAEINSGMDNTSQFCPCCQRSYGWNEEGSEVLPTELTCRHTLCSTCVKSQWIDIESSDDAVFCFTCSKRVGILSLKKLPQEECSTNHTDSPQNSLTDTSHLTLGEAIKEEISEQTRQLPNEDNSLAASDHKGISLQEWVNASVPENYIFRLVTTGNEQNIIGDTYILDNGLMVQTNPAQDPDQGLNTDSALDEGLEKVANDAGFSSISEGVTLQSNMIGSPDLNLKALLQMLEKSSENSLGGASLESCDLNQDVGMTSYNGGGNGEVVSCPSLMFNVPSNPLIELDGLEILDKNVCDQMEMDSQWRPVGIMQQATYPPSQEKVSQNQQCALYLQGRNVMPYTEKSSLGSQNSTPHEVGKMNSDVWLTHAQRGIPQKSNPKSRRGRKKKPLFRHFQSEFFMRPYSKRENSPQLQLVKLVRQRAQEKKAEEVKAAEAILVNNDKSHDHAEMEKDTLDDPELAFMKTVDMPSGKRVEDIYVVPPVWISNEKQNVVKPSLSKETHPPTAASNVYNSFPLQAQQRIPVQVYSHGSRGSLYYSGAHTPYIKHYQGYGQHHSAPAQSHSAQIPTLKTLHTSNDSFKPTQNMYKVIKGHIITTLNAPKIGPVPTLKEICKAALGLQMYTSSDPPNDNIYSHANGHHHFKSSTIKMKAVPEDVCPEIKSPKEFLDMKSGVSHQEFRLSEPKAETLPGKEMSCEVSFLKEIISQKEQTVQSSYCSNVDSYPCLTDDNNLSDIYDSRLADKLSDSEETLSENPLVSEDPKQMERPKMLLPNPSSCDLQVRPSSYKMGLQYYDQAGEVTAGKTHVKGNAFKESLKGLYSRNSTSCLTTSNSDYVIPIVSYKLKEPVKTAYINNSKHEVRQQECVYSKSDSQKSFSTRSFNTQMYQPNLNPTYFDQQLGDDSSDKGMPTLVGIAKQIKCLSSFEPMNKQLSNLTSALNLLCNAEKTLFESNFAMFRQMKAENNSKLGRLNLCIRKLGDSIVTIGWTLQQWSKPTSNRCYKTMGVLTDLYNSNIIGLIELITPYFHYICELIASRHSDMLVWNKQTNLRGEQMNCMTDTSQRDPAPWNDLNLVNTLSCSKAMSTFSYEETSKSSSPKEFPRQDNDHSLSSEDYMDRESEASNSGQTSAKTSPKIKVFVNSRRGRPLGSKNGQRKSRSQLMKCKPKRRISTMSPTDGLNVHNFHSVANVCQQKLMLPNTILVNMSSERFWSEANATRLGQAQNSVHLSVPSDSADKMINHPKLVSSNRTPWVLQGSEDMREDLNMSPVNSDGTLNLLDQSYQGNLEAASDLINGSTSKDTSTENSPVKKPKLEGKIMTQELNNTRGGLVYKMPENVNLLLQHSTIEGECASVMDVENQDETSDLQGYQNNIYYIKAENSDDELQLDNPLFSANIINSMKVENGGMHEKYQIAFLQDCPADGLGDSVKTLIGGSLYSGGNDHSKVNVHLAADMGDEDFATHVDPNDSMGDLCQSEASMNDQLMGLCAGDHNSCDNMNVCPNDVFGMSSGDNSNLLHSTDYDEHLG